MKKFLLLAAFLGLMVSTSQAQSNNQATSVINATISAIAELSVGGASAAPVQTFNFTNITDMTAGLTIGNAFTLTAKANQKYYVSVKAAGANFSGGVAGEELPVSTLEVAIDGGTFKALTASDQPIIGTSGTKIAKGAHNYVVGYKMTPGPNAAPATDYTTTLTYTLTSP